MTLPSMRLAEALGATGLLFSAGFLLNPARAHVQDRLHHAPSEQEFTSAGRKAGDPN